MPLTKNLAAYADVRKVFDTALRHGGGQYTLPSSGQAHQFRMRGNYFRKLLREEMAKAQFNNGLIETPYDPIVMRIEKSSPETIIFELSARMTGTFTTPEGDVTEPEPEPTHEPADLDPDVEEAKKLAARVRLGSFNHDE